MNTFIKLSDRDIRRAILQYVRSQLDSNVFEIATGSVMVMDDTGTSIFKPTATIEVRTIPTSNPVD